jgi:hypothetical protein
MSAIVIGSLESMASRVVIDSRFRCSSRAVILASHLFRRLHVWLEHKSGGTAPQSLGVGFTELVFQFYIRNLSCTGHQR